MPTLTQIPLPAPDAHGVIALDLPQGARVLDLVLHARPSPLITPGGQPGVDVIITALVQADQRAPVCRTEFLLLQPGGNIPDGAEFVKSLAFPGQKPAALFQLAQTWMEGATSCPPLS